MLKVRIRTYLPTSNYNSKNSFYVLSKGLNAGKPMMEPCANCFILECNSIQTCSIVHSLVYLLWRSRIFERELVGSVIPFLRVKEFKDVLTFHIRNPKLSQKVLVDLAEKLLILDLKRDELQRKLDTLRKLEHAYIHELLL